MRPRIDFTPKDRVVVVETVYYQKFGEQPVSVPHNFQMTLETDVQPYERQLKATPEWQPLIDQYCWVRECRLLHVINREGRFLMTNPSPEQIAEAAKKIIEIGIPGADCVMQVEAGMSIRVRPSDVTKLFVRSLHEDVKYSLQLFPL